MSLLTTNEFDPTRYRKLLSQAMPVAVETVEENERAIALVEELLNKNEAISLEEEVLLRLLVTLVQSFEEKYYHPREATPIEVLRHLMDARRLKQSDLWELFGSKGIASEVLNGKRSISKSQAKRLSGFFRVPVELFI